VKIAYFPTISQLPAWKAYLKTSCVEASNRKNEKPVVEWLNEVEKEGATLEQFAVSTRGFERLDKKLAIALKGVCKDALGRRIVQEEEVYTRRGRILTGRQILFLATKRSRRTPT